MLVEQGNISVGIDLGRDFSQITFCSKYGNEPITVVQKENNEANNYLIKTPDNLFSLIERKDSQGAEVLEEPVVTDGHITTSRGMGTAIDFAAKLVEIIKGTKEKDELLKSIVYGE